MTDGLLQGPALAGQVQVRVGHERPHGHKVRQVDARAEHLPLACQHHRPDLRVVRQLVETGADVAIKTLFQKSQNDEF